MHTIESEDEFLKHCGILNDDGSLNINKANAYLMGYGFQIADATTPVGKGQTVIDVVDALDMIGCEDHTHLDPEQKVAFFKNHINKTFEWWGNRIKSLNRDSYVCYVGWSILTRENIQTLTKFLKGKRIVDVAAGLGHFSYSLKEIDPELDITSIDSFSGGFSYDQNSSEIINLTGVVKTSEKDYDYACCDAVITSWPFYENDYDALVLNKLKSGTIVIFKGELGESCGTPEFESTLEEKFEIIPDISHELNLFNYNFRAIHDSWGVYIKL